MKIDDRAPVLVYVWIGGKLPSWSKIALKISQKNANLRIILITSEKCEKVNFIFKQYYLEDF